MTRSLPLAAVLLALTASPAYATFIYRFVGENATCQTDSGLPSECRDGGTVVADLLFRDALYEPGLGLAESTLSDTRALYAFSMYRPLDFDPYPPGSTATSQWHATGVPLSGPMLFSYSLAATALPVAVTDTCATCDVNFSFQFVSGLQPTYWFFDLATSGEEWSALRRYDSGDTQFYQHYRGTAGTWTRLPDLETEKRDVPEPSTLLLVATGAAPILLGRRRARRRTRHGRRFHDTPPARWILTHHHSRRGRPAHATR